MGVDVRVEGPEDDWSFLVGGEDVRGEERPLEAAADAAGEEKVAGVLGVLLSAGFPRSEIADMVGVTPRGLRRWMSRNEGLFG